MQTSDDIVDSKIESLVLPWLSIPWFPKSSVEFQWVVQYSLQWSTVQPSATTNFQSIGSCDISSKGNIKSFSYPVDGQPTMEDQTTDPVNNLVINPTANQIFVFLPKTLNGISFALAMSNRPAYVLPVSTDNPLVFDLKPAKYSIAFCKYPLGSILTSNTQPFLSLTSLLKEYNDIKLTFNGSKFMNEETNHEKCCLCCLKCCSCCFSKPKKKIPENLWSISSQR